MPAKINKGRIDAIRATTSTVYDGAGNGHKNCQNE